MMKFVAGYLARCTEETITWWYDLLDDPRVIITIAGALLLPLHVCLALCLEKLAMPRPGNAMGMIGGREVLVFILHGMNILSCLGLAVAVVWLAPGSPVCGFTYLLAAIILFMKLVSYAHANQDLRFMWRRAAVAGEDMREHDVAQTTYPANIGVGNMLYFWLAPTLCYQMEYPKTDKRRIWYILWCVLMLILVGGVMSFIVYQFMLPMIHEINESDIWENRALSVERLLTLALSSTIVWLLGFFFVFHLALNLLAEVLRFGDRSFYRDWWNAATIECYWKKWNLPVNYWMVRHVYFPALRAGLGKPTASGLCFVLSAVLHELLVSVPLHLVKSYALLGMLGIIPRMMFTRTLNKMLGMEQQVGNCMFWILCMVGQSLALLFYSRDYSNAH